MKDVVNYRKSLMISAQRSKEDTPEAIAFLRTLDPDALRTIGIEPPEEEPIDFNFYDLEGAFLAMRPVFADGRYWPIIPITESEWESIADCDAADLKPALELWKVAQARHDKAQEGAK